MSALAEHLLVGSLVQFIHVVVVERQTQRRLILRVVLLRYILTLIPRIVLIIFALIFRT